MNHPVFMMDKNLGFAVNDQKWLSFFNKFNIKVASYEDLDKMSEELRRNNTNFCYLPTANFFYLRSDKFYTPIANALFSSNNNCKISSLLIVAKESGINRLSQLQGKTLGYINSYCTSSYFAPALLLKKNGYSIKKFFSEIKGVGAWQLQIDAVIEGRADATMIQEDVWYSLPSNAEKTKIIDKVDNLPSPLIICATNTDANLKQELATLLLSYKPNQPHSLFNGFIPFQQELVDVFCSEASRAFS